MAWELSPETEEVMNKVMDYIMRNKWSLGDSAIATLYVAGSFLGGGKDWENFVEQGTVEARKAYFERPDVKMANAFAGPLMDMGLANAGKILMAFSAQLNDEAQRSRQNSERR